ncbi:MULTISPECIES: PGPGW domain-containing protein [unclassified Phenylobacterium]|uniref:PGPGW domain-containing protein n=1 Tax=unclassified Phenylobacterium TaxID=2640670 RepID=UPI001F333214|nr:MULTISPECIES: PGPGW domain-containing protein [unclassified Phenylobacterium]
MSLAMPSVRGNRATDDVTRDLAGRLVRFGLVVVGSLIVLAGILIAPLPGPGGIPVIVVGLMVILRNSFKARRQFVRLHQAHPRVISPIRRLLRRDPQILKMSWHQALKIERLLAPKGLRFMVRSRRLFRRRR